MDPKDKYYLNLQFWLKIHEKNAIEFQTFFENIMNLKYPTFQKVRPYGKKGDGGNDGYFDDSGTYFQAYAPKNPFEKEAKAAQKLLKDFKRLLKCWDKISKIKIFYFVFNDKGTGVSIEIQNALAKLRQENKKIDFKLFTPKNLEEIFNSLSIDQLLVLGFDTDTTKSFRIIQKFLAKIEVDIDRENGNLAIKSLEQHKDYIIDLNNEQIILDYEIIECRALCLVEKTKEAQKILEKLLIRYPKDIRILLNLAEIYLNNENFDKNAEFLKLAAEIDNQNWLYKFQLLIRNIRLNEKYDITDFEEDRLPPDNKIKSNFYRIFARVLYFNGDKKKASSYIERAIYLNPDKFINYKSKLIFLEDELIAKYFDKTEFNKKIIFLQKLIDELQLKAKHWGELSLRNLVFLNLRKINIFFLQENIEMYKLVKENVNIITECYFDTFIDDYLLGTIINVDLPPNDFNKIIDYLLKAEKKLSNELAKAIFIQFNLKCNLLIEGKYFFETKNNQFIINLLDHIENNTYEEMWLLLKDDIKFALQLGYKAIQFPKLRTMIIKNLPNDENIDKEKLKFFHYFNEKNYNEAFEIIKTFDINYLTNYELNQVLIVAKEKQAWDYVVKVIEKLLQFKANLETQLNLKLNLFSANLNLGRYSEAIYIGENILDSVDEISLLDARNKEILLGQTVEATLLRGEYSRALNIIEKYTEYANSFDFKSQIEATVYLKNNHGQKALDSIITGIKMLKTPTPEQYGILKLPVVLISNLIDLQIKSHEIVEIDHFIKLKGQDRWFYIGNNEELDATKISTTNEKFKTFIGKRIGENIVFEEKYRANVTEYSIENILSIDNYIVFMIHHHAHMLSKEHRWNLMEIIDTPHIGNTIETKYLIAFFEDARKLHEEILNIYCSEAVPLAFLALKKGNLISAMQTIITENRGFIKFSPGIKSDFDKQIENAKKIFSGTPFFIDGTSAFILSESGLLKNIFNYFPNLKIPQSVINLLLKTKERLEIFPGHAGYIDYVQGRIKTSSKNDARKNIENNLNEAIKLFESNSQNIVAISSATKHDSYIEQNIPADLCDACILARNDNVIVLTDDYLYLHANEIETQKKAPEYCSTFILIKELYNKNKISFDQYLDFFFYLSNYRYRFLPLTIDDIEKAVFGDGIIKTIQPEKIRLFNFNLTLSEEYGVKFNNAFALINGFLIKILSDDTILPETIQRIFEEIISSFPTNMNKKNLGKLFLCISIEFFNRQQIILGTQIQKKIDKLSQFIETYSSHNLLWTI